MIQASMRPVASRLALYQFLHLFTQVWALLYRRVVSLHLLTHSALLSVLLCNRLHVLVGPLVCTGLRPLATDHDTTK